MGRTNERFGRLAIMNDDLAAKGMENLSRKCRGCTAGGRGEGGGKRGKLVSELST